MAIKTRGVAVGDTKSKRKFATDWGTVYVPLDVVENDLEGAEEVTFTVEAGA